MYSNCDRDREDRGQIMRIKPDLINETEPDPSSLCSVSSESSCMNQSSHRTCSICTNSLCNIISALRVVKIVFILQQWYNIMSLCSTTRRCATPSIVDCARHINVVEQTDMLLYHSLHSTLKSTVPHRSQLYILRSFRLPSQAGVSKN